MNRRSTRLTLDDLCFDDDTTTLSLAFALTDYDASIWPDADEHPVVDEALSLLAAADEVIEGYTDPECEFPTLDEAFACYGRVPVRLLDAVLA